MKSLQLNTQKKLFIFISLGPPLGSYLYDFGGFTLPFTIVGSIASLCAIGLLLTAPDQSFYDGNNTILKDDKVLTFKEVLKVSSTKIKFYNIKS